MTTAVTVIERAIGLIAARGLAKGNYGEPGGPVDVMGALRLAAIGDHTLPPGTPMPPGAVDAYQEAARAVRREVERRYRMTIIGWNDHPGIDQDRVLEVLRRVLLNVVVEAHRRGGRRAA